MRSSCLIHVGPKSNGKFSYETQEDRQGEEGDVRTEVDWNHVAMG